jgi:hypothetical protein
MSYIVVDVESDDQSPAIGNMVCFGAVLVSDMTKTFYGQTRPIAIGNYNPEALAVSGFSREEHLKFPDPEQVMKDFAKWAVEVSDGKPTFISDNPAFDWQWINYYLHMYNGSNPFGFSARRIGDLYCGMKMHAGKNSEWKRKYRKTVHDHNPVNDAKGNAEALIEMQKQGLKIKF